MLEVVGQQCCVRLHGAKSLTGFKRCATTPNNTQQHPTTCNWVRKRTQHVTSNNVGSCWSTMLRPFARSLRATDITPRAMCIFILAHIYHNRPKEMLLKLNDWRGSWVVCPTILSVLHTSHHSTVSKATFIWSRIPETALPWTLL